MKHLHVSETKNLRNLLEIYYPRHSMFQIYKKKFLYCTYIITLILSCYNKFLYLFKVVTVNNTVIASVTQVLIIK